MDLHPIFDEENTALTRTNTFEPRVIYIAVRAMRVRWSCDESAMVVQRRPYFFAICITISAILRAESV